MAEKKLQYAFNFAEHSFSDLLKKTTFSNNWSESLEVNVKFDCLKGVDDDVERDLLELKNPKLVFSLMLHFLGRGLYCSSRVHEMFKRILKDNLIKSCQDLMPENSEYSKKIFRLKTRDNIEEIIKPYDELSKEQAEWNNESITWDQYIFEMQLRQEFFKKLKDSCNKHVLVESDSFFANYFACLHFDTYCWKNLKKTIDYDTCFYKSERTITYEFPNKTQVKCLQKQELQQHRIDSIIHMTKKKQEVKEFDMRRLDYKRIKSALLDTSILQAIPHEKVDDPDNHDKYELFHSMFGIEVQKNPATLIYNMMMMELLNAKKITKGELFDRGNTPGIMPYGIDGNVTASRYLSLYYSHIFDHWYSYDIVQDNQAKLMEIVMNPESAFNKKRGNTIKVDEMMKREHDLVYKWISYRAETDEKAKILRTVADLWNYLLAATQELFKPLGLELC